jgi:four helix bundle protein
MGTHRTLIAWQRARDVNRTVMQLARSSWRPWAAAHFRQLERAALSVQLNIAERYAVWSRRHLLNHLHIAYGSAVEVSELLSLLVEEGLIPLDAGRKTMTENARCRAALVGLIRKLSQARDG